MLARVRVPILPQVKYSFWFQVNAFNDSETRLILPKCCDENQFYDYDATRCQAYNVTASINNATASINNATNYENNLTDVFNYDVMKELDVYQLSVDGEEHNVTQSEGIWLWPQSSQ